MNVIIDVECLLDTGDIDCLTIADDDVQEYIIHVDCMFNQRQIGHFIIFLIEIKLKCYKFNNI